MDYLIVRNPDKEQVKQIVKRIKENNGYCPCRFERTPDTLCHCKDFRETGDCICGLFIKVPVTEITKES